MRKVRPFALEDFHAKYEHVAGLYNLATSDALYWGLASLREHCPEVLGALEGVILSYPDPKPALIPALTEFCRPPPDAQVLPTTGAAESIHLALAALRFRFDSSPRIGLPRPAFGAFAGLAEVLGYQACWYDYRPELGWHPDKSALLECGRHCDVVVVNSPHNPTGAILDEQVLLQVSADLAARNRYLLADEVFLLPEELPCTARLGRHVVALGSLSKMYGMPGLRLGWTVAARELHATMQTLQQYSSLSLNAFSVEVGAPVVRNLRALARGAHLTHNRMLLRDWARANAHLVGLGPCEGGTTTVLEAVTTTSEEVLFSEFLGANVLVAPGTECFGVSGQRPWFRIGYGGRTDQLGRALQAIENVLTKYH